MGVTPPAAAVDTPRQGFSRTFLSVPVDVPTLAASNVPHAFMLDGSPEIPYTHFSLAMNTARRLAFWVAWNIDGGARRSVSRKGMRFVVDPRLPTSCQVGEDLYAGNRLDRGHIARRADVLWGDLEEARKANADSFCFTNITPQMDDFNQSGRAGLWGKLEDAVFEDVAVEGLKVSVFGGPVFHDDDRTFRGVRIPREFWKVIVFVEDGMLKAKGFLLTQSLDALRALNLGEFKVFQVGLGEIETRCGLSFGDALEQADRFGERLARQRGAHAPRPPLDSQADIDWS
jgi:endonuclease G